MKFVIKNYFRKLGIELEIYNVQNSNMAKLQTLLRHHSIDMVIDVGANIGQFARDIRLGGYRGQIVSFEPLSSAYHELMLKSRKDKFWEIAPRAALGDEKGENLINISSNSASSSILNLTQQHIDSEENVNVIGQEKVNIYRLDSIAKRFINGHKSIFIKIDTQGYEKQVIEGATNILKKIKGFQIEMSFIPLYDGQALFLDTIAQLAKLGYKLYDIAPGFADKKTGQLLQADGVFVKK